jgi:hypothetical protein
MSAIAAKAVNDTIGTEQFKGLNRSIDETNAKLERIANALGSQMDVSTWKGIQEAVKSGFGPDLFPVGTMFDYEHSQHPNGQLQVVAHNHFKNPYSPGSPTMTLMAYNPIGSMSMGEKEALYVAPSDGSPAGIYVFTVENGLTAFPNGIYTFTLQKAVPAYARFAIYTTGGVNNILVFDENTSVFSTATALETATLYKKESMPSGYNNIGTTGVELNDIRRTLYGGNNYYQSVVNMWLNADEEDDSWWYRRGKYQFKPNWAVGKAGFLNGLEQDLREVIVPVTVPCSTNNMYEDAVLEGDGITVGSAYTIEEKVFLPSQKEIIGSSISSINDNSSILQVYQNASAVDRIKYFNDAAVRWYTRTPYSTTSSHYNAVTTAGVTDGVAAYSSLYIVPMFNIG